MIETLLAWLGMGDKLLTTMGPLLTVLLAVVFGGFTAQFLKFQIVGVFSDPWYDRIVRLVTVLATAAYAHFLSDTLSGPLEIGVGFAQIGIYHLGLAGIRKWVPWLECSPLLGSTEPPVKALQACAQRDADRAGQNSGI